MLQKRGGNYQLREAKAKGEVGKTELMGGVGKRQQARKAWWGPWGGADGRGRGGCTSFELVAKRCIKSVAESHLHYEIFPVLQVYIFDITSDTE